MVVTVILTASCMLVMAEEFSGEFMYNINYINFEFEIRN